MSKLFSDMDKGKEILGRYENFDLSIPELKELINELENNYEPEAITNVLLKTFAIGVQRGALISAEIDDECAYKIKQVSDNLSMVKIAIVEGGMISEKVIDNGLFLLENILADVEQTLVNRG